MLHLGDTVNIDGKGNQATFVIPGGNYYIYPDETPVTANTTWSGSYCPNITEVEEIVANAGGWQSIQQNGTTTGTINMLKGQMYKKTRSSGITRATLNFPEEIDDNYKSRLVVKTASSFTAFTITSTLDIYFYGDDCTNGELTGVAGKYYDIQARADGLGGILVEVFSK